MAAFLERHANELSCLKGYETKKLLGVGTQGTVLLMCRAKSECHAVKLQLVLNRERFERQVRIQAAFVPFAPVVWSSCLERVRNKDVGVIVMEAVTSTLDRVLAKDLTARQMQATVNGLHTMLEFARSRKLVHGDLAFHNIGVVQRRGVNKMVFIDFDRSSDAAYQAYPTLDALHLLGEFTRATRSGTQEHITKNNDQQLLKADRSAIVAIAGTRGQSARATDALWKDTYCAYCKAADVPCLADNACEPPKPKTHEPAKPKTRESKRKRK
jgi:tRNA A-37 threonylcarbamoyl transferase component Bud32